MIQPGVIPFGLIAAIPQVMFHVRVKAFKKTALELVEMATKK